jgi:hypothetical protein
MKKIIKGEALTKKIEAFLDNEIHKYKSTGLTIEQIATHCDCHKKSIFARKAILERIHEWQEQHPTAKARAYRERINSVVLFIEERAETGEIFSLKDLLKRHKLAPIHKAQDGPIKDAYEGYLQAMGKTISRPLQWPKSLPRRAHVVKTAIAHMKWGGLTVDRICRKAGVRPTEYNQRAVSALLARCPQFNSCDADDGVVVYSLKPQVAGRVA